MFVPHPTVVQHQQCVLVFSRDPEDRDAGTGVMVLALEIWRGRAAN